MISIPDISDVLRAYAPLLQSIVPVFHRDAFVKALNDCETANFIHVELKSNKKELSGDESVKRVIDRLKK